MNFSLWLGTAILLLWAAAAVDLLRGSRRLRFLRDIHPALSAAPPRVSVIAAARNEARNLRQAIGSLLSLDYPELEFILVNDRSEDATGAILEELAAVDRRLRVVHISELPPGWLGKNYALWAGSRQATGELLLFTDADIVMAPSTLARAITLLQQEGLDHLAATPETRMPGVFLNMFAASFILFFSLYFRPWQVRSAKSRAHIGIGAFNLVRAAAYRQVGGHATIRLRPDDDLKLGKILKLGGFRQDVAYGTGLLTVEWYASLRELVRGLEKNAFAGADYRIATVLWGAALNLSASVWPYLALFLTGGAARIVYAAVVAVISLVYIDSAGFHGARRWYVVGFPLTAALFIFILLRTMVLNIARGGITWRGTFYPLEQLKANKV